MSSLFQYKNNGKIKKIDMILYSRGFRSLLKRKKGLKRRYSIFFTSKQRTIHSRAGDPVDKVTPHIHCPW